MTQDKQEAWETWEMGFDEFRNFDGCEYGSDFHSRIKAFIRSLLAHQREEIRKKILNKMSLLKWQRTWKEDVWRELRGFINSSLAVKKENG